MSRILNNINFNNGLSALFLLYFFVFSDKSGRIAGFHSPIVRLQKQTVLAFLYEYRRGSAC